RPDPRNWAARPRRPRRRRRRAPDRDKPDRGRDLGARRDRSGASGLSRASALQAALVPAAGVYGIAAESVAAHYGRLTTYAGSSGWLLALELAAGWGLVAAGLVTWRLRPGIPVGPLAVAAGFAWFAPDWVGWDGGTVWVRSVGMLAAGVWLAL